MPTILTRLEELTEHQLHEVIEMSKAILRKRLEIGPRIGMPVLCPVEISLDIGAVK